MRRCVKWKLKALKLSWGKINITYISSVLLSAWKRIVIIDEIKLVQIVDINKARDIFVIKQPFKRTKPWPRRIIRKTIPDKIIEYGDETDSGSSEQKLVNIRK